MLPYVLLNLKLKTLKSKLKIWNKEVFGNIHHSVQVEITNLNSTQSTIDFFCSIR